MKLKFNALSGLIFSSLFICLGANAQATLTDAGSGKITYVKSLNIYSDLGVSFVLQPILANPAILGGSFDTTKFNNSLCPKAAGGIVLFYSGGPSIPANEDQKRNRRAANDALVAALVANKAVYVSWKPAQAALGAGQCEVIDLWLGNEVAK